jgi:ribulose-phosphate 3-epimerase
MAKKNKSQRLIAPSILSADFARLGEQVHEAEKAGADWIHVDVMDGHFVPNLTVGPAVTESLNKVTQLPLDVHLMVSQPDLFLEDFVVAGAECLTVHQEAVPHLHRTINLIRELDVMAGVSINPATPVEALDEILPFVDLVLVMSVNPGFGGQKFIPQTLEKVRKLVKARKSRDLSFLIEIDGGINESNAAACAKAGCDVFVVGSAIFHAKSISAAMQKLGAKIHGKT